MATSACANESALRYWSIGLCARSYPIELNGLPETAAADGSAVVARVYEHVIEIEQQLERRVQDARLSERVAVRAGPAGRRLRSAANHR